jgi:5-amino-6-(5-phosphoribosylamino)uracil reductase
VVLAASLDGKIADRDRTAARFSSTADLAHLEAQVAQADGVLFGADTLRAYGTCLRVRSPQWLQARRHRGAPPQPVQLVCSGRGDLDPQLPFFQQPVPRGLLTTDEGAQRWRDRAEFDHILPLLQSPTTDWRSLAQALHRQGLKRLALLGGGTLVAAWAAADLIDEMHLTLCPLLLGGRQAPTPCDGDGVVAAIAPRFTLASVRQAGDEVFLHYRRQRGD